MPGRLLQAHTLFSNVEKTIRNSEPVTIGVFFGVRLWFIEIQIPMIHIQYYFGVIN